jgi:protein-S-isoprenylcysteine O-methyltransferase Ste14
MRNKTLSNAGLLFLALVFSAGLMFAFIELPGLLDSFLQKRLGFPQFDQGGGDLNALKTEMFIRGLHLRWIGYGSLFLIFGLILYGYSSRKPGWAMAGAVVLFIPVFGQFALSMFFLAGLGFLRIVWLPMLEVTSFNLLDLGRVIYVPYWVLMWIFGLFKWNAHTFLTYLLMGSGAFIFTWGVLVWFRSRFAGEKVAASWIYRFSRHPQYLGWILWSYGFILFTPFINQMKKSWSVPSSLPWLLMTMAILGICMMEELKMMKLTNGGYQEYRSSAPFLFPLPSWLNRIITWPARLFAKGGTPTRGSQVVWITLTYTGLLILLSLFWVDFGTGRGNSTKRAEAGPALSAIMQEVDGLGDDRKGIWSLINEIATYGEPGMDSLLILAVHPNPIIREFSMQLLGNHGVTKAEELFIASLNDSLSRVRSAAILAAGKIRSEKAVDGLVGLADDPSVKNNLSQIYIALGSIGDPNAIPCLTKGLEMKEWYYQVPALNALMEIDPVTNLHYAFSELNDPDVNVRRNAVMTCIRSGNFEAVEPLRSVLDDEDYEVRFYAKQGIKKLEK